MVSPTRTRMKGPGTLPLKVQYPKVVPSANRPSTSTLSRSTRTVCGSRLAMGGGRSSGSREMSASTSVCGAGRGVTMNCPCMPASWCPGTLQK